MSDTEGDTHGCSSRRVLVMWAGRMISNRGHFLRGAMMLNPETPHSLRAQSLDSKARLY